MFAYTTIRNKLNDFFLISQVSRPAIARLNNQRVMILALALVPVHIGHIIFFWAALAGTTNPDPASVTFQWRMGIITAHAVMLILSASAGMATYKIRSRDLENFALHRIIYLVIAMAYLLFGAILCVIDQMVLSSINPYLIASLAVALAVIMKPWVAAVFYGIAYITLFFTLPLTQSNPEALLSLRVNGFGATAISLGLSLILWRSNALNLVQQALIERQNKQLEKKNEQLKYMARTDMLTGLFNRMRFTEFVEREIGRIERTGDSSSLLLLDLDHFKRINDLYGHPNGDTVLKLISGVINAQLRKTDILARFGGEEFAILLPGTNLEGAYIVAEKIRQAIEGCTFTGRMEGLRITASFGIAPLNSSQDVSFHNVYQETDKALYRAKNNGRNRVELAR